MRSPLGLAALALALPLVAFTPAPVPAQETPIAGMKTIELPLLLDLPGDLAFVRYTPGSLDRSAAVQARFELFAEEFTRSGYGQTTLVFYVLSREDWEAARIPGTYGLPKTLGTDAIAVPGWADGAVVEAYSAWLGGELPHPKGHPILATPAEAGSLSVADLLTQLEVARLLGKRARLAGDRPWIAPLMAHLTARLFWDRYEPGRAPEIAAILDRLAANEPRTGLLSIGEWRDDLPIETRFWFDARFLRGADRMATEASPRKLWRLVEKGITGKEPLTAALLLERFPSLGEWLVTSFGP